MRERNKIYHLAIVMPPLQDMMLYSGFVTELRDLKVTTKYVSSMGGRWSLETHDPNSGLESSLRSDQLIPTIFD